jgi:nucleotide-binding universal stress UspA family protein
MTFSHILVPVKGIPADDAAIRLACQIAKGTKAQIIAIHVIEVERNLPLDVEDEARMNRADKVLAHAEHIAKSLRSTLETEVLQARSAGAALMDEAAARGVDLIVMGIPYRQLLGGDFQLGTTTQYVLKNATCPVWLCREAAPAKNTNSVRT